MQQPELIHVANARKYIGTVEVKGTKHNPKILALSVKAFAATGKKSWIHNDEIPWCGSYLGGVFAESGLGHKIPKEFYRAREWESAGTKLTRPAYGCVVTFTRDGGGHVGIVVGKTKTGMLKVLGGNQSNAVTIQDFDPKRVTSYRWISSGSVPHEHRYDLPVLPAGRISTNEA